MPITDDDQLQIKTKQASQTPKNVGVETYRGSHGAVYSNDHSKTMKVDSMIPINELLIKSKVRGSRENSIMGQSYMTKDKQSVFLSGTNQSLMSRSPRSLMSDMPIPQERNLADMLRKASI